MMRGEDSGGAEGGLNEAIKTVADAGKLSQTVFKLNPYDWYVITGQGIPFWSTPPSRNATTANRFANWLPGIQFWATCADRVCFWASS